MSAVVKQIGQKPEKVESLTITAPRLRTAEFKIVGTAPYCQHRFSQKALEKMKATQKAGQQAKGKKVRDARNFEADFEAAKHVAEDGWLGIPAPAIRTAMIDACRMVGFKMTMAKLAVFVEADGFDKVDGMPLIKIEGDCEMHEGAARNSNGSCDIRVRPLWRKWSASIRIRWDEDQFSLIDVTNLLARAGIQVGIGEGRPNSRMSPGIGWGTFEIAP
jgi:hypothetical protein